MDTFSLPATHDLISAFTLFTYWIVSCFKGFSDLLDPWWISMEIIGKHGHILFSEAFVSSACRITNLRWWGKTISSYMSTAPHTANCSTCLFDIRPYIAPLPWQTRLLYPKSQSSTARTFILYHCHCFLFTFFFSLLITNFYSGNPGLISITWTAYICFSYCLNSWISELAPFMHWNACTESFNEFCFG